MLRTVLYKSVILLWSNLLSCSGRYRSTLSNLLMEQFNVMLGTVSFNSVKSVVEQFNVMIGTVP